MILYWIGLLQLLRMTIFMYRSAAKASIGYSYDDSSVSIAEPDGNDSDDSEDSDADSVLSDIGMLKELYICFIIYMYSGTWILEISKNLFQNPDG